MVGKAAAFSLLILCLPPPAIFSFDCGNSFVYQGDRREDVLRKCGEPDSREVRDTERFFRIPSDDRLRGILQEVEVEEWTYNLGPDRFMRVLRFEDGRLVEIETGDYGN